MFWSEQVRVRMMKNNVLRSSKPDETFVLPSQMKHKVCIFHLPPISTAYQSCL